ncbi:MAG TPA: thioredoxin domain-containing protein, partial [Pedococcus sp.]|nr:thioredoxin domain-containing protein [Pedococcus sp.]
MNRLANSTSPYLLQHKDNPVDWQEWGPEAFAEARRREVPILLSIGYAACHWCHVMAHESFEDDEVAAALNDGFVAVKVDREERPDVDAVYMTATTALTGHGGWPMTCVLTPEGEPFFCGTYFPRQQFLHVLDQVGDVWANQRDRVLDSGAH